MLRIVADTNIYVSAFAFGGAISDILELAQENKFELYISPPIIQEIERVFAVKIYWAKSEIEELVNNIMHVAYLVHPDQKISAIRDDPTDDKILECAVTAYAHIIVSGDNHLLKLNHFRSIEIMNPRDFLDYLKIHKGILK